MTKNNEIIYLHRYPIEYESKLFPPMKRILELLKPNKVTYVSMKSFSPKDNNLRERVNILEVPIKINPTNERDKIFKTLLFWLYSPVTLIKIKRRKPSLIICKELLPFVPSIAGRLNVPILIEVTDWWLSSFTSKHPILSSIAEAIERFQVRDWRKLPCLLVTHTEAEKKVLIGYGFPASRILVSHYSLFDSTYFPIKNKRIRMKTGLPADKWIVAVHGIMHPNKGYDQLLSWWKTAVKIHPDWMLLIIGGGGKEQFYRRKIEQLGISKNVIATGWLPTHEDVNEYLNASDCLLITRKTSRESLGATPSSLFHSLSLQKPVVITGLPGMSEVLKDGINGYIFKPDNFTSFLSTLEKIYKNPSKAKSVASLGLKAGKDYFNPERSAKSYVHALSETISKYSK